jgi:hypothetical protein
MRTDKGNWNTYKKPAIVPFCPPQIPHDLTWDRALAAVVENRRLTAWAVARPISQKTVLCSPDSYQSMLCRGRLQNPFIPSVSCNAALRIYSTIASYFYALLLFVTTTTVWNLFAEEPTLRSAADSCITMRNAMYVKTNKPITKDFTSCRAL